MLELFTPGTPRRTSVSGFLKALNRALCTARWLLAGACPLTGAAQLPSVPFPLPGVTVSYVSEVPWPADSGEGNPLERWAKKLSADWAAPPSEVDAHLKNLRPELSWGHLKRDALNNVAQVFVIQAYELLEQGQSAGIEALLTPARNGKAANTEFVILRRREAADGPRFTMRQLEDQEILVDRGGCGDLVYRWLETEIKPDTGNAHRETFAQFHSAKSPAEAILAVYFREAYACVVTRESCEQVFRTNPRGFNARLEEVRSSPALLKYVVACRKDIPTALRKDIINSAAAVRLEYEGTWALAVPSGEDWKSLATLVTRWQDLLGDKTPPQPESAPVPSAASGPRSSKQTAASKPAPADERRQP